MKKQIWVFLFTLLIGIGVVSNGEVAFADTMSYSVEANIPGNQIDKSLTYFDLRMSPGDTQTISLTVQNSSSEEITIMIEPNTATTNQNGVIDYSSSDHEKDSSLKYAFSDIISPAQEVTLAGNETKEVSFTIEMPEESFDGIILGGFYVYQVDEDNDSDDDGVQIKNKYAYVIGAKLRITDTEVTPDLTLNNVEATLINYRTAVTANLQNTEATIIRNLEVTAKVTKEGSDEVLHETTKTDMSMAPNSNFDFPINWDNQALETGTYHLYITATDGDQTWEFDKVFEIGDVSDLNEEAVDLEENNTLLYIGIAVGAALLILLIIILLRRKKRRDNDGKDEE